MGTYDCECDTCSFNSHARKSNILYYHYFAAVTRQSAALSFANQHSMPSEFLEKFENGSVLMGTPSTLLYARYRVKLKNKQKYLFILLKYFQNYYTNNLFTHIYKKN